MAAGPSLDDRDPRARRPSGGTPKRITRPTARRGGGSDDRPQWRVWLVWLLKLGLIGGITAVAFVVGLFAYYGSAPKMPHVTRLDEYHPKQVTRNLDRNNVP